MNPTLILGIVLAISLAGNAFLFHSRDNAIEEKASAQTAMAGYKGASEACSKSVDTLADKGKERHVAMLAALTAEADRIKGLQHDALETMRAKPSDPKDLCASLERYWREQIKRERGTK